MNSIIQLSGLSSIKTLWNRIANSNQFIGIWVLCLIVFAGLALLLGFVGLIVLVVVATALVFTGGFPAMNLVGILFAAKTLSLAGFDFNFWSLALDDGNSHDPQQPVLVLTFLLSLVCLVANGLGAYFILAQTPEALLASLVVPVADLVFFAFTAWAWWHSGS